MASKAPAKEESKDKKAEEEKKETKKVEERPPTPLEVLYKNIERIVKAVNNRDRSLILRVLRYTNGVRCHVPVATLVTVAEKYVLDAELKKQVLAALEAVSAHDASAPADTAMEGDVASPKAGAGAGSSAAAAAPLVPPQASPPTVGSAAAVEIAAYLNVLAISLLVKRKLWSQVSEASLALATKLTTVNKRTLDIFGGKAWGYFSLAHEKLGVIADIRGTLHDAHRTACLRHDEQGQAVLLNLLTRNYLHFNLHDQANKLISKATFPEGVSNNQFVRHLFYKGRIQAIQLDYSDALNTLMHADRKAPSTVAIGFRSQVKKFLLVVQLLLGEVPERSVFQHEDFKTHLKPYFELTQAVRVGDVVAFNSVLGSNEGVFRRDLTLPLIVRLRQNVIKTGLKKISLTYSRISFADIAVKLHLDSAVDAQFLCAKAIRDGVIEAAMDDAAGSLYSREITDAYSTSEPQQAFDRRIKFCLDVHNDAVTAMKYPEEVGKKSSELHDQLEMDVAELAEELDDIEEDDGDL